MRGRETISGTLKKVPLQSHQFSLRSPPSLHPKCPEWHLAQKWPSECLLNESLSDRVIPTRGPVTFVLWPLTSGNVQRKDISGWGSAVAPQDFSSFNSHLGGVDVLSGSRKTPLSWALRLLHDSRICHWAQLLRASSTLGPGDPVGNRHSNLGMPCEAHCLLENTDLTHVIGFRAHPNPE